MLIDNAEPGRWSAACDYITCTLPETAQAIDQLRWAGAVDKTARARDRPAEPRHWSWMGYTGWTLGTLSWGARQDGSIIRASSDDAAIVWFMLPVDRINVSRFDVAYTFWLPQDEPTYALQALQGALAAREQQAGTRRRKIRHQNGTGDGDTLYIGSRSSSAMGRLYDKWRESGNDFYKCAWRAEIEYKRPDAKFAFRYFRSVASAASAMAVTACSWFEQRGVNLPRSHLAADRFRTPPDTRTSTDARQLAWLAVQVSPSVRRLLDTVGREQVELALGLRD